MRAQGKNARAARSETLAASELYRAMDMRFWVAKADLALEAVR